MAVDPLEMHVDKMHLIVGHHEFAGYGNIFFFIKLHNILTASTSTVHDIKSETI